MFPMVETGWRMKKTININSLGEFNDLCLYFLILMYQLINYKQNFVIYFNTKQIIMAFIDFIFLLCILTCCN